MPDVAVIGVSLNTLKDSFHRIVLIWAQHHETLVALMQYDILGNHLAQRAAVEKHGRKQAEVVERIIGNVSPIKSELVTLIGVVGKVTSVHTVADDKDLNVIEQSVE